ncbi:MAG: hypothetical protein WKF42_00720 [Solirubrobacteraceae bacterium]
MSFFDDDEPRTTRTRPRKPVTAGTSPGSDPQQLLVRRLVAAGVGLLVIVVLVLGVNGCLDGRREQALKDYNRDVSGLVEDVDANTSEFFDALTTGGTSSVEVRTTINQLRLRAQAQTRRGENLGVPGDMKPAQRNLLLALGLIEETMGKIAEKILSALSTDSDTAEPAVLSITGEMQAFLAADVVYKRRTVALVKQVLDDQEIGGQAIQSSSFLPNIGWLDAPTVARRIQADAGRGAGADAGAREPTGGTHGHGLIGVSVGDVTLQSGPSASNRIPVGSDVTFNVKIANQGENPESDVVVQVTITPGGGGKKITARESVDQTTGGAETTVTVALGQSPPISAATIEVEVRKVAGEDVTTNNTQEYTAIFARE